LKLMYYLCRHLSRSSLLFLLLTQGATCGAGEGDATVKAAVIFNLLKFIEWPAEVANREQIVLCANGEGLVSKELQVLEGKTVNGKMLTIRQSVQAEALRACHMVYLEDPRAGILRDLRVYPVVTVASSSDFIEQGGMIALVSDDDHIGFEINQGLAVENGIRISALLLKLARAVRSGM